MPRAHAALGVCLPWDCCLAELPSPSAIGFGKRKGLTPVNNLWSQPGISPAGTRSSIPSRFPISWDPSSPLAWTLCAYPTLPPLLHGPALRPALNLCALTGFPRFSCCLHCPAAHRSGCCQLRSRKSSCQSIKYSSLHGEQRSEVNQPAEGVVCHRITAPLHGEGSCSLHQTTIPPGMLWT